MVTDKPIRAHALLKPPGILYGVLCGFIFFAQVSMAQDQIPYWPQQEESPRPQQEVVAWRSLVQKFQQCIKKNAADKDVRISFLNTPYGKYCVEDLMAYTLSGDGAVTIQMHDTLKHITVPPEELYWLGQFLLEHHLEDLPEKEPEVGDSAEFRISLRIDNQKRTLLLYNSRNNKDREIMWQYLYSFGLRLLQTAGLSDQNKPIMPICRGVTDIREMDTNDDGLIDWLKLKIEFSAFKSGDFTFSFGGRKTGIFLAQGNSAQYAYINTYLLRAPDPGLIDYSKIKLDTKPPNPKGPYVMDLNLDMARYAQRADFRTTPDISGSGAEPLRFEAGSNQEVILEMTRANSPADRGVVRFFVKDAQPDRAVIGDETESIVITAQDPFFLHDIDCIGCILTYVGTNGSSVVFETSWIVPNKELIASKIQHFNEAFASDHFYGDKERARLSLDNALSCKEAIERTSDLQINVIYTAPAQ